MRKRTTLLSLFTVRRLLTVAGLVLAWCALWGSFSLANLLSGTLVGVLALSVGVGGSGRGGVRLGPMLHLAGIVALDMVMSTATVARVVLTPGGRTEEAIIAVPISAPAKHHLLLLFVAITVTPGTAVVAAESDGSVLYLHVLDAERRDAVEVHVQQLADLACEALPTPDPTHEPVSELEVPS